MWLIRTGFVVLIVVCSTVWLFLVLGLVWGWFDHRRSLRILARQVCPNCRTTIGGDVARRAEKEFEDGLKAVVDAELNQYPPEERKSMIIEVIPGDDWTFTCPTCSERLSFNYRTNQMDRYPEDM